MQPCKPSLDEVKKLSSKGNLVPIYKEIEADLETPVSVYLKVAQGPYSFLLESVEGGERVGRYSFIGTEPYKVIKTGPGQDLGCVDPLNSVQKELDQYKVVPIPDLPRFHGGAVGYLAYDVVHYFEPSVPIPDDDMLTVPQSLFMFSDTLLVFDHIRHDIKVVSHVRINEDIEHSYNEAVAKIDVLVERLSKPLANPPKRVGLSEHDTAPIIDSNFTKQEYSDVVSRC